jgi:phosphatidylserine/phosphatidylglycerophosphate/cardiolipin synthase-like enzyme
VSEASWFLSTAERGNIWTRLDRDHPHQTPWTSANDATPLIHGRSYFRELLRCIRLMRREDLLLFADWRGDPDQLMDGQQTEVGQVLSDAAQRGVVVKGLVWRSHLDRFAFSEQENRHLGEEINNAGGEVVRDMRVRPGGSHHQKFVVLRHPGRPDLDVAFVGGIDLCHSRRDDADHLGDQQRQPMAKVYGPRPPWHDLQVALRGPAVNDVEAVFRERWEDPSPLNRNPLSNLMNRFRGEDIDPSPLPTPLPPPASRGTVHVQLLRTYPRKRPAFPFAPAGEFSVAHAYEKVVMLAHSLIYIEDQYFWNAGIVASFAHALQANPGLRLIVVLPLHPDQDGRFSEPPNLIGRMAALDLVREAGGERVGIYGIENSAGVPIYVHAKVGIVDDVWASVGSDNINRRSWTHDSELACAMIDDRFDLRAPMVLDQFGHGARVLARDLRLRLAAEHLDRDPGRVDDLADPVAAFGAFAETANVLQSWHENRERGPRPLGRLRPYPLLRMSRTTALWAGPLYRALYDPDGRRPH